MSKSSWMVSCCVCALVVSACDDSKKSEAAGEEQAGEATGQEKAPAVDEAAKAAPTSASALDEEALKAAGACELVSKGAVAKALGVDEASIEAKGRKSKYTPECTWTAKVGEETASATLTIQMFEPDATKLEKIYGARTRDLTSEQVARRQEETRKMMAKELDKQLAKRKVEGAAAKMAKGSVEGLAKEQGKAPDPIKWEALENGCQASRYQLGHTMRSIMGKEMKIAYNTTVSRHANAMFSVRASFGDEVPERNEAATKKLTAEVCGALASGK